MKKYTYAFLLIVAVIFASCSGSDVYRGNWKATDPDGNKFDITFEAKSFKIKAMDGKVTSYQYTQNSVKIENSVRTYGIHLDDGRAYLIFFPFANDHSKAVIMMGNNQPVFTLSRNAYIEYKDLYELTR